MFDTMKVARKIREARISQNMTQMNLADAMEVSYQAVSNWERGNSMPDIAKLEQLCQVLHIGMEELLGTDSSRTLNRIIKKEESKETGAEPLTMKEIEEVAPLLPPSDVEQLVDDNMDHMNQQEKKSINLAAIVGLAPFLDTEYLDKLAQSAHVGSLAELTALAPFLSEDTLDSLALNADVQTDMGGIVSLAPFLSEAALDKLALQISSGNSLAELAGLAPFLSEDTLDSLALRADTQKDMGGLTSLAPFLSENALNKLALQISSGNSLAELTALAPFLSKETLNTLVLNADLEADMGGITCLAPFLKKDTLHKVLDKATGNGDINVSGLFPFLSR